MFRQLWASKLGCPSTLSDDCPLLLMRPRLKVGYNKRLAILCGMCASEAFTVISWMMCGVLVAVIR
eukprot:12228171-Alexandrium_andersonii.AAC.1